MTTKNEPPNIHGGTIELIVGADAVSIHVHESLIRPRSAFFDSALNKCWKEGIEKKVALPEDHKDTVVAYIQHLYTGKMYDPKPASPEAVIEGWDRSVYPALAAMFVFGERVQDTALRMRLSMQLASAFSRKVPTVVSASQLSPRSTCCIVGL
ncbi:hypothetical protein LTR15_009450 [Elasticomyces elasticus]|nr:hypothetical protein LTR15_009450 [Elasticomyces elasticus]